MSETKTTSKLSNFIGKYWIWLIMVFGIVGIIIVAWSFSKHVKKATEKGKQ